jgi:hypothetical protein
VPAFACVPAQENLTGTSLLSLLVYLPPGIH